MATFGKPIHPGEVLADELKEIGISPTELARQLKVPANRISMIIHGKRAITGDTALRLGIWFRMNPRFWLNLQQDYDLMLAREELGAQAKEIVSRPEFASAV